MMPSCAHRGCALINPSRLVSHSARILKVSRYSFLTSSSPSRDEDSFCKTAMPRREDIVSCIDVTIMDRSAHSALPPPLALEHFDRQFVAVIEYGVDLARQAAKPRRVLVLHPQAKGPNSGRSRPVHPYSIPKEGAQNMRQKRCKRPEMRNPRGYPSPALKAGVSREEL